MATIAEQIAALEAVLASGTQTVEAASGDRVTMRSTDEIMQQLAYLRSMQAPTTGRRTMTSVAQFDRGY